MTKDSLISTEMALGRRLGTALPLAKAAYRAYNTEQQTRPESRPKTPSPLLKKGAFRTEKGGVLKIRWGQLHESSSPSRPMEQQKRAEIGLPERKEHRLFCHWSQLICQRPLV
jgi:hypothetical protein